MVKPLAVIFEQKSLLYFPTNRDSLTQFFSWLSPPSYRNKYRNRSFKICCRDSAAYCRCPEDFQCGNIVTKLLKIKVVFLRKNVEVKEWLVINVTVLLQVRYGLWTPLDWTNIGPVDLSAFLSLRKKKICTSFKLRLYRNNGYR